MDEPGRTCRLGLCADLAQQLAQNDSGPAEAGPLRFVLPDPGASVGRSRPGWKLVGASLS